MKSSRDYIHVAIVIVELLIISGIAINLLMGIGRYVSLALIGVLLVTIAVREILAVRSLPAQAERTEHKDAKTGVERSSKETTISHVEPSADNVSAKEEKLHRMFEEYLITNQNFLQPGLTIVNVAEELGTNKTYLSKIVNSSYGMTFPELMNSLRIDYAEQYILHNKDAKQADVAMACGFANASAFNNTFKKLVGITPKAWLDEKTSK